MRSFTTALALGLGAAAVVSAAPTTFPKNDGFPNPNPQQLLEIEKQAFGTLSNATGNGKTPANDTFTVLKVIAINELFETAYFESLVQNITDNLPGYAVGDAFPTQEERDFALISLQAIVAQEELHAINANNALKDQAIQPCKYKFPVTNFKDAIALANTFTDVVLGTLQDGTLTMATDGDGALVPGVVSVAAQEGEQNGWFRTLLGQNPSALPFLTRSTGRFALSALIQNFVVPDSCPNLNTIPVSILPPLTINGKVPNVSGPISISWPKPATPGSLQAAIINQQNVPLIEELQNVVVNGDVVTATIDFPVTEHLLNDLSIIALVPSGSGPFNSAEDVAKVATFGPALAVVFPDLTSGSYPSY